jgi:hypothetical protein
VRTFTGTIDLTATVKRVISFFVSETAGAAAVVNFRNGSSTGAIFQQVRLPAVTGGNSIHVVFAKPLLLPSGLYVEVVSGTLVGGVQSR